MPKQINSAAVGQRLVRLFSLKGRFQPVLDEVIVPVVSVDPEGVESKPAWGFIQQNAVAAEFSYGCLFNPSTSGMIITVTGLEAFVTVQGLLYGQVGFLARTNAMVTQWRDDRLPGSPDADAGSGTAIASIAASAAWAWSIGTDNQNTVRSLPKIVLGPGDGFLVMLGTANQRLYCSFAWEEQPITSEGYSRS